MAECRCDMKTKLVGDGCEVCNPSLALRHAEETIAALRAELAALKEAVRPVVEWWACDKKELTMRRNVICTNDASKLDALAALVREG